MAMALRSQSDDCACAFETGWLWPLGMAKRVHEWATRGGERRNTAAYGHGISLGAFTTALGLDLDEAGSVSCRAGIPGFLGLAREKNRARAI